MEERSGVLTTDIYYEIYPKVFPADSDGILEIRPRFAHAAFAADVDYELTQTPMDRWDTPAAWTKHGPESRVRAVDGGLRIKARFSGEQEHCFVLKKPDSGQVLKFHVYSLAPDLFTRKPYRADFHLHSRRSDGRETPAYVAARCRMLGLDAMAITDHGAYAPSIEAQESFAGVPIDLLLARGEEIHPPNNHVHLVNWGGEFSVNDLCRAPDYNAKVAAIERALTDLGPGVDRHIYAAVAYCLQRIREGNGLGIFCHPYWIAGERYNVDEALVTCILAQRPFDAYEIIGGFSLNEPESNILQVARYHDERARGRSLPIVGVSDAHGFEREAAARLHEFYSTVVFAPELSRAGIIRSIKDLYSVAVETLPGERKFAWGPHRLVKFALFALREIFPLHDELCAEEGCWMLRHLEKDPRAAARLAELHGKTSRYLEKCWATR